MDEELLERVRAVLAADERVQEKRMVGGRSFLCAGRLCCGVNRHGLVVRVGPGGAAEALAQPHVNPLVMGKETVESFVVVAPAGVADDADLVRWVRRGIAAVA